MNRTTFMPRFTLTESATTLDVAFDDGGMNLLSAAALDDLAEIIERIEARNHEHRLVTFRSLRARLFAAGADMAEMARFGAADAALFARQGQELFGRIERLPHVTVALIDGDCFGGALDLTLAFDLRFATSVSRFSHPGSRIGIVTGFGGTSRWRNALTMPVARNLFLGNDVLSCAEAQEARVIDRIVGSLDETAAELERLCALPAATTRMLKELNRHSGTLSPRQTMHLATRLGALYGGC